MATVTRNGRRRRSADPSIQSPRGAVDLWTFLLCVLREPKTSQAALEFTIVGCALVVVLSALGVLAFILHPSETHAIIGTIFASLGK